MSLAELLAVAAERRIVLEVRSGRLHIEAPRGTVTPELRDALVRHKAALLDYLAPVAFVTLKGGLVVPAPALELAIVLEARGVRLATDADHQFIVPNDPRLTDDDLAAIHRWRHHLGALIEYEVPPNDLPS